MRKANFIVFAFIPVVLEAVLLYLNFFEPSSYFFVLFVNSDLSLLVITAYLAFTPILLYLYFSPRIPGVLVVVVELIIYILSVGIFLQLWPLSGGGRSGIGTEILGGYAIVLYPFLPFALVLTVGFLLNKRFRLTNIKLQRSTTTEIK